MQLAKPDPFHTIVRSMFLAILLLAGCDRQPGKTGVEELVEANARLQIELAKGRTEIPLSGLVPEGGWQTVCVLLPYGTIDSKKIGREFDSLRAIPWIASETFWAILIVYPTKISVIKIDRRMANYSPTHGSGDCFDGGNVRLVVSQDASRGRPLILVTK